MRIANGSIQTTYDGKISLGTDELVIGPGLQTYGTNIELDFNIISVICMGIIKSELQNVTLDLDKVNKMWVSGGEDRVMAKELLNKQTKYTVRLLEYIELGDSWNLSYILAEYQRNNLKLSKEIL